MNTSPSLLLQCAHDAAAHQAYAPGALYVVATPIGNLADLTLRAVHVLSRVDAVACEDTRVGGGLLRHLGLQRPLLALHAHNEHAGTAAVLQRLAAGESVAYVSDAGTPGISDPGAVLVAAARAAGHPVVPLPGASSVATAVSVAGDAVGAARGGAFVFVGFLPAKGGERTQALQALVEEPRTQVLLEAPHRVAQLVRALADAAPQRQLTLCRELSKQFETVHTAPAGELPAWLAGDGHRERGEFVLVLHAVPPPPRAAADELPEPARRTLQVLLQALPLKQAVALAVQLTGQPRNALYRLAVAQRAPEPATGEEADDAASAPGTGRPS